jgi:type IV pilus assembly protein PilY1
MQHSKISSLRIAIPTFGGLSALAAAALLGNAMSPQHAGAQEPDIRSIRPAVMLLVDSSGSMDYEVGSASGPTGSFPTCTESAGTGSERNRWITLLESMTGGFDNYYCSDVDRRTYTAAADQYYPHASYEPAGTQRDDGILDVYLDRVKFGLMTLDAVYGFTAPPFAASWTYLPPVADFAARTSDVEGAYGGYSYGPTRTVSFPGCPTPYSVNAGARRAFETGDTFDGYLVSVGSDSVVNGHRLVNQRIQETLLRTRPFGGSAMDALLDDFREYLTNDPDVAAFTGTTGDPLQACRERYAILISEGEIDTLYRSMGCDTAGYSCPYPLPTDTASDLCQWDGTQCTGDIDGLFVVGYDVANAGASSLLDDIASEGGTNAAYQATDQASLLASLSAALDRAASGTTTRTTPAYAASSALFTGAAIQQQFQVTSGFRVGESGAPWSGVLERTRYTCTGPSTPPDRQPLDVLQDSFHEILNARDLSSSPRVLYTVAPTDTTAAGGVLLRDVPTAESLPAGATGSLPRVTGLELTAFSGSNTDLVPALFGIDTGVTAADEARRDAILDWVHGEAGTPRDGNRFGDIYHSSPVIVTAPRADLADEAFNAFRLRPEVAGRPTVLYVGTNDGVLHAFAVEDHEITVPSARTIRAGEELWGFVPPILFGKLESAMSAHQSMVDATPVVHDVFFRRQAGDSPAGSMYHTVLLSGLRDGGAGYFALDVTDPLTPSFLWQFRRDDMGDSYGRPAIGQAYLDVDGELQQRAIAILPGGTGEIDSAAATAAGATGCVPGPDASPSTPPTGVPGSRSNRRCWDGTRGRALYVVDVATGEVIREFDSTVVPSPMTGGVSLFTGDTGTIATRAYMTDADGVLWRLDFTARDPAEWSLLPIHDLYWNDDAVDGATATEPPIVSTDEQGNVIVIVGTGDLDDLESARPYRIASLVDRVTYAAVTGVASYATTLNWEIHLRDGEQVTGPLELFDSRVYFGTFAATDDPLAACEFGSSRIWGVEYARGQSTAASGYSVPAGGSTFPVAGLEGTLGSNVFDAHFVDLASNTIALGVAITRTPTCITTDVIPDPYLGINRESVASSGGGEFSLTAQVSGPGGATVAGGASVSTFSRSLPAPQSVTYVTGWAGTTDY